MEKKLNKLGIGPKVAFTSIPALIISILLSKENKLFNFPFIDQKTLFWGALIFFAIGIIFYFLSVIFLLKGLKNTELITSGPYGWCQNPLYSSFILFIIPAISFYLNSWLILTTSLLAYLVFKRYINQEYEELQAFFGNEFLNYRKRTNELIPFPRLVLHPKQKIKLP